MRGIKDINTISIHAPREGSDPVCRCCLEHVPKISIHAPREGSDDRHGPRPGLLIVISIHAPREGSDIFLYKALSSFVPFLSTLPARGATRNGAWALWTSKFLSTLPARGATTCFGQCKAVPRHFYPRSPRGERHFFV